MYETYAENNSTYFILYVSATAPVAVPTDAWVSCVDTANTNEAVVDISATYVGKVRVKKLYAYITLAKVENVVAELGRLLMSRKSNLLKF